MSHNVFECQKCGHCCEGKGGIVLGPRDLRRLASFLNMEERQFINKYCVASGGKIKIASGADNYCVFFNSNAGCAVHLVKPDVCRAWPFFRGNLEDRHSLAMAKSYCPGIQPDIPFSEFSKYGLRYLKENSLFSDDNPANALGRPGRVVS